MPDLLGETDNIGSLSIGKYADIVVVKGNSLDDITLLESVSFVMQGGILL